MSTVKSTPTTTSYWKAVEVFPLPRRSAFTLLELLLTLAVLSAIAAVAIPQFGGLLSDRRLTRAADQLRIEMVRLRVDAMRKGRVMMLEGKLQEGSFRTRPYHSLSDATESTRPSSAPSALATGADQAAITAVEQDESSEETIELPTDVLVNGVSVVSAARAAEITQSTAGDQAAGWSQPILFYQDGTTSTASVTLHDPEYGTIQVKLRGINGDVTVGQVQSAPSGGQGGA